MPTNKQQRGPGRPPGETLRRPRVIQLSDAEYQVAQHLGDGNASAGIRRALDRFPDENARKRGTSRDQLETAP